MIRSRPTTVIHRKYNLQKRSETWRAWDKVENCFVWCKENGISSCTISNSSQNRTNDTDKNLAKCRNVSDEYVFNLLGLQFFQQTNCLTIFQFYSSWSLTFVPSDLESTIHIKYYRCPLKVSLSNSNQPNQSGQRRFECVYGNKTYKLDRRRTAKANMVFEIHNVMWSHTEKNTNKQCNA